MMNRSLKNERNCWTSFSVGLPPPTPEDAGRAGVGSRDYAALKLRVGVVSTLGVKGLEIEADTATETELSRATVGARNIE